MCGLANNFCPGCERICAGCEPICAIKCQDILTIPFWLEIKLFRIIFVINFICYYFRHDLFFFVVIIPALNMSLSEHLDRSGTAAAMVQI